VSVAAGVILASAYGYVAEDIEAVRRESLSRVGGSLGQQRHDEQNTETRARRARPASSVTAETRPLDPTMTPTKQHNGEEESRYE
jgi:hypothetical protein